MLALCGAAIFVEGHVGLWTNGVLAFAVVVEGVVSNSRRVLMAFSSLVAFITVCLVIASCNCLMAEMSQSVADIAGS